MRRTRSCGREPHDAPRRAVVRSVPYAEALVINGDGTIDEGAQVTPGQFASVPLGRIQRYAIPRPQIAPTPADG